MDLCLVVVELPASSPGHRSFWMWAFPHQPLTASQPPPGPGPETHLISELWLQLSFRAFSPWRFVEVNMLWKEYLKPRLRVLTGASFSEETQWAAFPVFLCCAPCLSAPASPFAPPPFVRPLPDWLEFPTVLAQGSHLHGCAGEACRVYISAQQLWSR